MTPELLSTLASILAGVSGAGNAWFWYDKRRMDKEIDSIKKSLQSLDDKYDKLKNLQIEHENKFITETKTRELLQEAVNEIKKSTSETNSDVKEIRSILSELSTELRVINAIQNVTKEFEKRNG